MTVSTSIRLEQDTLDQIDAIALAEGRSRSWLLQQAVKDALEVRNSYNSAVNKGIEQALAGDFLTDNEVDELFKKYEV